MLPLLAQLDIDFALVKQLLGAFGGAGLAGLIVRQWVSGRLAALAALEAKSTRDRARWLLLAAHMRGQRAELNRQRRNAHEIRNVLTAALFAVDQLAQACSVRVSLPTAPEWDHAQLDPVDLPLEIDEKTEP